MRIVTDYVEELGAGNPRHHTISKLKTGVKHDGTIVAHKVEYIVDSGAYAAFKPYGTIGGANQGAGPYRMPNVTHRLRSSSTRTTSRAASCAPRASRRACSRSSPTSTRSRAQMGIDPVDFRLKNLMVEGEETGWRRAPRARPRHRDAAGRRQTPRATSTPKAPDVGRGVAVGDRGTGAGEGTAQVTLRPDGKVVIGTPIFDQGTGIYTTLHAGRGRGARARRWT